MHKYIPVFSPTTPPVKLPRNPPIAAKQIE
jgi:hypothetical protein